METFSRPSSPFYIGYGRLEDLVAAHADPSQPFYAELTVERAPGQPLGWAVEAVTVQDFDPEGRVRYCRITFGGYDLLHGRPFDPEDARRVGERARRGYDRIADHLASQGFRVERALVAAPRDLPLLAGSARLLLDLTDPDRLP